MKIVRINKPVLKELEAQISTLLNQHYKDMGLNFRFDGGHFSDQNATIKLVISTTDADGHAVDPERKDFMQFARNFGLEYEWLDQTVVINSSSYKIVGLATRRRRFPVVVEANGHKSLFTTQAIINAMKGRN